MYAGRIVEQGPAERCCRPAPPVHARPDRVDPGPPGTAHLRGITGAAPRSASALRCAFAPRCALDRAPCRTVAAASSQEFDGGHLVRCIHVARTPPAFAGARRGPESQHRRGTAAGRARADRGPRRARRQCRRRRARFVHDGTARMRRACRRIGERQDDDRPLHRGAAPAAGGAVRFDGAPLAAARTGALSRTRRRIQIVFQNPYDSLNPSRPSRTRSRVPAMFVARDRRMRRAWPALLDQVQPPERARVPLSRRALRRRTAARRDRARARRPRRSLSATRSPRRSTCRSRRSCSSCSTDLRRELGLALLFISHDLASSRRSPTVRWCSSGALARAGPRRGDSRPPRRRVHAGADRCGAVASRA